MGSICAEDTNLCVVVVRDMSPVHSVTNLAPVNSHTLSRDNVLSTVCMECSMFDKCNETVPDKIIRFEINKYVGLVCFVKLSLIRQFYYDIHSTSTYVFSNKAKMSV
jgi:hypothetical protein